MRKKILRYFLPNVVAVTIIILFLSLFFYFLSFFFSNANLQNILVGIGSSIFSVFVALIIINLILASADRAQVAQAVQEMLTEQILNEKEKLFQAMSTKIIGPDNTKTLLEAYNKDKNLRSISQTLVDKVFDHINAERLNLAKFYRGVGVNCSDVSSIFGWQFDHNILTQTLKVRTYTIRVVNLVVDLQVNPVQPRTKEFRQNLIVILIDCESHINTWLQAISHKAGPTV